MAYFIGIDIGTGSTKAVAINSGADSVMHSTSVLYPTLRPFPHYSEQEPEVIWNALVSCIHAVTNALKESPVAIGISCAMHSLIPVNDKGEAMMNMMTWADGRAALYAEQLKQSKKGEDIYRATGTPIHAMAPLAKICWLREKEYSLFRQANKFISIKEYIWWKLFGEYEADYSVASATGLFDIKNLTWYSKSLQVAGIDFHKLSTPVNTTHSRNDVNRDALRAMNLSPSTQFVIGATDGCLANLGSNAIKPGLASLTIGTSGAIRVASTKPWLNFKSMTFNYRLDEKTFISGGPTNNGGAIFKWFAKNVIEKDLASADDYAFLLKKIEDVKPGADGLTFLPYLMGERAPIWDSTASGVFFGMNMSHTQRHFVRAVIEGISMGLYTIGKSLEDASGKIDEIYASGGFVRSPIWLQIMANIFNKKIYRNSVEDASAIGAALIAMKAVDNLTDYPVFKPSVPGEPVFPDHEKHLEYQQIYPVFVRLYTKLKEEMSHVFNLSHSAM